MREAICINPGLRLDLVKDKIYYLRPLDEDNVKVYDLDGYFIGYRSLNRFIYLDDMKKFKIQEEVSCETINIY